MRIQLLTGGLNVKDGGPPRVVIGSAIALADRGHHVQIASLSRPGDSIEDIRAAFAGIAHRNIDVQLYPTDTPARLGRSRAMQRALSDTTQTCDVVHAHGIWESCLASAAAIARQHDVPFFVSAHGMLDQWSLRQSALKKKLALGYLGSGRMLRGASAIIYGTKDELTESSDAVPDSVGVVVPNGIDLTALHPASLPDSTQLLKRFPQLRDWSRRVLFFSRIHPKKGLDLLVEAFIDLAPDIPGAGLLIAGIPQDVEFEASLRKTIKNSPVADRILFVTDLNGPDARVVFKETDIFALPSHQEGFSIAILEAMALEKPLLITNRCHLPEVETHWNCGRVVNDDVVAIKQGLKTLLMAPDAELTAMGARGRKAVEQNYSWDAVAAQLEALYSRAHVT